MYERSSLVTMGLHIEMCVSWNKSHVFRRTSFTSF